MAYEKYTWTDGELITAEKLNHMENGIAEGGSGEAGYECTETTEQLFEETVTTVDYGGGSEAELAYSDSITADKILVWFEDTQYICPKIIVDGADNLVFYGGMSEEGDPDFTNYPFVIASTPAGNRLATETANTYYIEVAAVQTEATNISPCFASAVRKSSDSSVKIKTATLSAEDISVDGEQTVIMRVPPDYGSTVGVLTIVPLETEDVYLATFDCSGDRGRLYFEYKSKQTSPVTLDLVECIFTYIPRSEGQ